jgi:hypothetical protein
MALPLPNGTSQEKQHQGGTVGNLKISFFFIVVSLLNLKPWIGQNR